jgi:hypothetical protein
VVISSTPPYVSLRTAFSVEHRDNFTTNGGNAWSNKEHRHSHDHKAGIIASTVFSAGFSMKRRVLEILQVKMGKLVVLGFLFFFFVKKILV